MTDLSRHFHPVLRASRLRDKPVRVEIGGVGYALWRDRDGEPRAVMDRCPHRHAPLSKGVVRPDGRLACGYHGWHFDGAGVGCSPAVPDVKCSVAAYAIVQRLGWLWLGGSGSVPEFATDGWDFIGSHGQRAPAPLHVVVDNFSENEHTPYVHDRLGWREEDAARVSVETKCEDDRTEVTYIAPQRPSRLLPLVLVKNGDTLRNEWVTRFSPVHSIYTLTWRGPNGEVRPFSLRVAVCFVPESERTTNIVSFMFSRLEGRSRMPRKALDAIAYAMGWKEVWDDKRWLRHIADTQRGFEGMRLTRFDKPLAHNRRLMDALYYGSEVVQLRLPR
jgi:phenylpropionate dioxygenase-like ring-hydroxylating dioxygenase large terminal subunit